MAANTAQHGLPDIPFTVQGYVTDPKFIGYQVLTNYENIYWRAYVGNEVWSLYEVLRGFCHEGNPSCFPSIRYLSDILGLKDRRRLTGRITKTNGVEYRYPGLIDVLQEKGLVIAEVKGEEPMTQYVFHVNLTPPLLKDDQLATLPLLLQERHQGLIEKCEDALAKLEARKRPSKVKKEEGGGNLPGGDGNLPEGVAICQGGGGNLPPEQQQSNSTQLTLPKNNTSNNNKGESETDVVVALLVEHGIAQSVANTLAKTYPATLIRDKVAYVDFLKDEGKVNAPAGWLRKAIEQDYAAPDGFMTPEERRKKGDAETAKYKESFQQFGLLDEEQRRRDEAAAKHRQRRVDEMRREYGATAKDKKLSGKLKAGLRDINFSPLVISAMELICVQDAEAVLATNNQYAYQQLRDPDLNEQVRRVLNSLDVNVDVVKVMSLAEEPV